MFEFESTRHHRVFLHNEIIFDEQSHLSLWTMDNFDPSTPPHEEKKG
jgi:hypothetical protein